MINAAFGSKFLASFWSGSKFELSFDRANPGGL